MKYPLTLTLICLAGPLAAQASVPPTYGCAALQAIYGNCEVDEDAKQLRVEIDTDQPQEACEHYADKMHVAGFSLVVNGTVTCQL